MSDPLLVLRVEYEPDKDPVIVLTDGSEITVYADEVSIGYGTRISPDLEIGMPGKRIKNFITGSNCRFFGGKIAPRNFVCGDYVTIHDQVWAYGRNDIVIGHNAWFGMRCTLDAEGGFQVGNGFGAGQDTHMWSHIRHGDVLAGCRYLSFGKFIAADDVWLVGRCTSGPAFHQSKSIALAESNLTHGMESNSVYGGNPAVILNDKLGRPYKNLDHVTKQIMFKGKIEKFFETYVHYRPLAETEHLFERFNLKDRTYKKKDDPLEIAFMRFILPEFKFVPENRPRITLEQ